MTESLKDWKTRVCGAPENQPVDAVRARQAAQRLHVKQSPPPRGTRRLLLGMLLLHGIVRGGRK